MDKKEWIKHCKWVDTFRGKIVEKNYDYDGNGSKSKKEKKDTKKKKNS